MFEVSPASLQTFINTPNCVLEDRVQYSRSTFRMYSVMAIFTLSIVWGLFEYNEFFIAPQRNKLGGDPEILEAKWF